MSTLLGRPGDRWSLAQAVDALGDSARRAGVPGLIWVAGVFYPSLNLTVELALSLMAFVEEATGVDLPGEGEVSSLMMVFAPQHAFEIRGDTVVETLFYMLLALPAFFVLYRVIAGLALVSDPQIWEAKSSESSFVFHVGEPKELDELPTRRTTRLRTVWRAGKGLGPMAFGLWIMLLGLLLGATLVLTGPLIALVQIFGLSDYSQLFAGLLIPVLLVLLAYAVVLMVVNQLALHSMAHNRRGVASALTHAWRLVRASPMSVTRATLVDFVLFITVLVTIRVLRAVLTGVAPFAWIVPLLAVLLYGFAGVTRAGFWARTYRALGGLSSADHGAGTLKREGGWWSAPGLEPGTYWLKASCSAN